MYILKTSLFFMICQSDSLRWLIVSESQTAAQNIAIHHINA